VENVVQPVKISSCTLRCPSPFLHNLALSAQSVELEFNIAMSEHQFWIATETGLGMEIPSRLRSILRFKLLFFLLHVTLPSTYPSWKEDLGISSK
jgi:hypothetical protein